MPCPGCKTCGAVDSYLVCDACSRPTDPYRPYVVVVHATPGSPLQATEIRPAPSAPTLVTRTRARPGAKGTAQVPVCPRCGGDLVRR